MKLVSSSPKTRHTHSVGLQRGWFLKRLRSRLTSATFISRAAWCALVIIVAAFALSVFHLLRQTLETVAGQ